MIDKIVLFNKEIKIDKTKFKYFELTTNDQYDMLHDNCICGHFLNLDKVCGNRYSIRNDYFKLIVKPKQIFLQPHLHTLLYQEHNLFTLSKNNFVEALERLDRILKNYGIYFDIYRSQLSKVEMRKNLYLDHPYEEYDIGYSINDGVYFEDMRSVSTTTLSVSTEIILRVGTQVLGIGDEPIPEVFALHQNYPNPFNPTTQIRYDLPEDANVNITIYDIMGRSIRSLVNSQQIAGYHSIQWNATNNLGEPVSAGMYIYMIQAGKLSQTKKMVLLK